MERQKYCIRCSVPLPDGAEFCHQCGFNQIQQEAGQYSQQPTHSQPYRPAVGFVCPYCHTTMPPMTYQKVSTGGWVIFSLLFLTCVGILLAWIGLFFKEGYTVCSQCGIKLG